MISDDVGCAVIDPTKFDKNKAFMMRRGSAYLEQ